MLNENLKAFRKWKGISQEELAVRLNVVRQTISKWETGLSVPDADILVKIAEVFEVSVSELLGNIVNQEMSVNDVAEQLAHINEQLAIKNRRSRLIWKVIAGIAIAFVIVNIFLVVVSMISFDNYKNNTKINVGEILQSEEVPAAPGN